MWIKGHIDKEKQLLSDIGVKGMLEIINGEKKRDKTIKKFIDMH